MTHSWWLVEYVGATPCPVYARWAPTHTCDPREAAYFETKAKAEAWMVRPGIIPFKAPWTAVSHGFMEPARD